ncbi:MAG: NAD(P)-binding domain-containing protein [Acidobacteriaceae bacterium]|nr:NAD(P)-binding domain-containing protein [Acidobacteriaceae bacterium]
MNLVSPSTTVAIIGAGPYGLSLAAHLNAAGVPCRIFGTPMNTWKTQMPEEMKLKSDGFASNLFPGHGREYTLEQFCREQEIPYHPTHLPVALSTFVRYGEEFARRFIPQLEEKQVLLLAQGSEGFLLTLDSQETLSARFVVIATGLSVNEHIPKELAPLQPELVSHTRQHRRFESFLGKDVAVLGRGASALNAAVLLQNAGGRPVLITRKRKVHVHTPADDQPRTLYQRLRKPSSPLGPSLRSFLASRFPHLFRTLPAALRRLLVWKHLGPSGGVALHGQLHGRVEMLLGWRVQEANRTLDGRAQVSLENLATGEICRKTFDHVLCGTGFQHELRKLPFLAGDLIPHIRIEADGSPKLDSRFQSSMPGLFFAGPAAAASFGPLLRFAAGASFAAEQISKALAQP